MQERALKTRIWGAECRLQGANRHNESGADLLRRFSNDEVTSRAVEVQTALEVQRALLGWRAPGPYARCFSCVCVTLARTCLRNAPSGLLSHKRLRRQSSHLASHIMYRRGRYRWQVRTQAEVGRSVGRWAMLPQVGEGYGFCGLVSKVIFDARTCEEGKRQSDKGKNVWLC